VLAHERRHARKQLADFSVLRVDGEQRLDVEATFADRRMFEGSRNIRGGAHDDDTPLSRARWWK
jgi:hypothetical protein